MGKGGQTGDELRAPEGKKGGECLLSSGLPLVATVRAGLGGRVAHEK